MAVMHPDDLENYLCTDSEKEFYFKLKKQLPDRIQVFYSVRWFDKDENDKRVDSECDFLVFDPSFGFLTIEVKGGTEINIDDNKWVLTEWYDGNLSKRELNCSPYEQSEKSMRHFHKYFVEEYNQAFNGVYGCAVAFPRYSVQHLQHSEAPRDITIDFNDINNLSKRINEIFHYWKNKRNITIPFSAEQRTRFINVINKRISLSAAAGALIPIKEKEFKKIDFVQDNVLDILYHYKQVQLVGGAGTGKTFIAMKKAQRDIIQGKKVLFVCCNQELINMVNKRIKHSPLFDCYTYENLMVKILDKKYYDAPINGNGSHCCFDLITNYNIREKYDSIIVDEAQDFDNDMGLSIRSLMKNDTDSDLYVFYDKNQNVFLKNFENAFSISYPPFILRYNIRNTGCIYQCAVEKTDLGQETIANNLIGVEPELFVYKNISQTLKTLSNIVNRLVNKEYVKTTSIVILSDLPYDGSILAHETRIGSFDISFADLTETKDNQICFKTVEQFKGLESDVVIYLENCYKNLPTNNLKKRKDYVAITRARYYLYILTTEKTLN